MSFFPFLARVSPPKPAAAPGLGLPIARVKGIRIAVDPSWFIMLIVLTLVLHIDWTGRFAASSTEYLWLAAIVASLAFFGCVLIHEFSHSLLAKARGITVEGITLFIFGGVSRLRSEPTKAKDEFVIAAVGPLTSLALGGLFLLVVAVVPEPYVLTRWTLRWLGTMNVVLAIFNLLPAFPLDGGRVLRASIWILSGSLRRATRLATKISAPIAWALMAIGAIMMFGGLLNGLLLAFIGWFLLSAAQTSLRETELRETLSRRRVHQVMRHAGAPIPPTETVETFVDRRVLGGSERGAFVAGDGISGWVSLEEVKKLDRDKWEETPLQQIMVPLGDVSSVKRSDSLFSALEKMNQQTVDQLPVVEDGELLGVVTREDLLRVAAIDLELQESREA